MIKSIGELLWGLKESEARKLANYDLKHGPTIGDMYEGLSRKLLARAIPPELDLRIVDGFIVDGRGAISRQIDCMLVSGQGEEIPFTGSYKWDVRKVLAVVEVKKTLYGEEMRDSFDLLAHLRALENDLIADGEYVTEDVQVSSGVWAYEQTTGKVAPEAKEVQALTGSDRLMFHTLVWEQVKIVRIVLGYDGFKDERRFRRTLYNLLLERVGKANLTPGAFPELIVSGGFSLVKSNGQPYVFPVGPGGWPFYSSTTFNPVQLILEMIWTKIENTYGIGGWWGEDMELETLKPCLFARASEVGGRPRWEYAFYDADSAALRSVGTSTPWSPTPITIEQWVVLKLLGAGHVVDLNQHDMITFIDESGATVERFRDELLQTRFVAFNGYVPGLTTGNLAVVRLADGSLVAGDDKNGQLSRWLAAQGFTEFEDLSGFLE